MELVKHTVPDPGAEPLRNARHETLVREILAGKTAVEAYRQIYAPPKASDQVVWNLAHRASNRPEVIARMSYLQRQLAQQTLISRSEALALVIEHSRTVLAADSAEISQVRRCACRYCHGPGHAYQWRTEKEYWKALEHAAAQAERWDNMGAKQRETAGPRPELPTDAGGFGYRKTVQPHPDCPECDGLGTGETWFADTRTLSRAAALLYDGVEETKNGMKIRQRSKDVALQTLAKYAGLGDTVDVRGGLAVAAVTAAVTPEQAAAIAKKLAEDY